jgi:hypothetical protein
MIWVIEGSECRGCELDPSRVLKDPALKPTFDRRTPILAGSRGRGVVTGQFRFLDEDEMLIWEVGQCSFCYHTLEFRRLNPR